MSGATRPPRRQRKTVHATIRHYAPGVGLANANVQPWRGLAAALGGEPGLIPCAVVATRDGGIAAITLFDDAASLAGADRWIEGWLAKRGPDLGWLQVQVITGEVVAQRGL